MKFLRVLKRTIKMVLQCNFFASITHRLAYVALRLLFLTYRLELSIAPEAASYLAGQRGIFYFWHQNIISGMFFFYRQQFKGACVVSPSPDGQIAGFLCTKLGLSVLYGSAHKSPVTLVRKALRTLEDEGRICLVGDGSRGPAFQLQPGLPYLAHKTDLPLIFVACTASRSVTLHKSWDKFKIPLPFSTIQIQIQQPVFSHIS